MRSEKVVKTFWQCEWMRVSCWLRHSASSTWLQLPKMLYVDGWNGKFSENHHHSPKRSQHFLNNCSCKAHHGSHFSATSFVHKWQIVKPIIHIVEGGPWLWREQQHASGSALNWVTCGTISVHPRFPSNGSTGQYGSQPRRKLRLPMHILHPFLWQ